MESANGIPVGTQTLVRGIDVIRAVAGGATSLKTVIEQTHLSHSTAHRLIQTLRAESFLREDASGRLCLGPALIELGFRALDEVSLQSLAHPILIDLAERTGDTVHLAIEDSGKALYLDKVHGSRSIEIRSWPGCRMPLSYTGIGKALMLDSPDRWRSQFVLDRSLAGYNPKHDYANESAFYGVMMKFKKQGFTYDLEENEAGIRCVAVPIKDAKGKIAAAISVSGAYQFMPPQRLKVLGPILMDSAACISAELGYETMLNDEKD